MEDFKLVHEERYCDVVNYLNEISQVCSFQYPLAFVKEENNNDRFAVIRYDGDEFDNDQGYVVAYMKDGLMKSSLVGWKQGLFTCTDDKYIYFLGDKETNRVTIEGDYFESLDISPSPFDGVKDVYDYKQWNPTTNEGLALFYPVINNISEIYVNYLNNKVPDLINYEWYTSNLLHKRFYMLEGDIYRRFKVIGSRAVASKLSVPKTVEEMNEYFSQRGFNTEVPTELIRAYTKNNETFKQLRRTVDTYKSRTSY